MQAWLERPSWHLRFPAKLEERFESDSADARRQWLFRCGLVGLAIFNLFFLTDQAMVPDITVLAKTIRLGFVSPIVLVLPHSGSSVAPHVTVSAGIAIKEEDNSTSDLMERADAALYRAKASGRHGFRIDGIPSLSPTS